jgi:hypothetical protein
MHMVRRVTSDPDASPIRELHGVWELLNLESWVRHHIG